MDERSGPLRERLPVSLILAVSMIAAGVVYPVTDSALKHRDTACVRRRPDRDPRAAAAA
jgi:hypothetical protein